MTRRITYHQQPGIQVLPQPDARPSHELGSKVRAALTAGLSVFILAGAISLGVVYLFFELTSKALAVVSAISLVLSVLSTACLTFRWSLAVAERDWRVEDLERKRRWKLEDEDRKHAAQMADAIAQQQEDEEITDYSWVPIVAFEILQRHFFGQSTTRHACTVDAKLCSQADWNLVNQVFLAIGLKRGYKLTPGDTLEEAWATWAERVKLADEDILVRKGPQLQWKPIEVE